MASTFAACAGLANCTNGAGPERRWLPHLDSWVTNTANLVVLLAQHRVKGNFVDPDYALHWLLAWLAPRRTWRINSTASAPGVGAAAHKPDGIQESSIVFCLLQPKRPVLILTAEIQPTMKISPGFWFVAVGVSLSRAQRVFHIVRTICIEETDPNGGVQIDASIQLLQDGFGCGTTPAAETDNVETWPAVLSFPEDNPWGYGALDFYLSSGQYYYAYERNGNGALIATCGAESASKTCFVLSGSCNLSSHFRCVAPS
ncbi:hypothetical protein DFH08DRAFT_824438 [Mycena albidolilacea]|uniref:Uncharacterized protein n=1 Tax=Mycena albidolilacea TaxID=1033008 RepID=A0AAD6Z4S2_9AGAR|nr:hypothetical protein DFH08DRAFT_824438 [Mycena albidolilacea]